MRIALAAVGLAAAFAVAAAASARDAAHGVPGRFRPETAAAVGARDYWVFGDHRCGSGWCLALVRSTDGGAHFTRLAAPPLTSRGTVPTLLFASARDGYAYTWTRSPLYVTHDGGASWQRASKGSAIAVSIGGREVFAVTGRCSDHHGCRNFRFLRSSVTRTGWRSRVLPGGSGLPFSLAARGGHLWLLGETNSGTHHHDRLARSSDGGGRFSVRTGPCFADLGGRIVPAGDGVVWAVCPSGMMAELTVSTNGGRSFSIRSFHDPDGVGSPALTNSAQVAAASTRIAILNGGGGGALLRTTDTGRHWHRVPRTADIEQVLWLGFGTRHVGAALVQTHFRTQLWRTTDAGATWHSMPIR